MISKLEGIQTSKLRWSQKFICQKGEGREARGKQDHKMGDFFFYNYYLGLLQFLLFCVDPAVFQQLKWKAKKNMNSIEPTFDIFLFNNDLLTELLQWLPIHAFGRLMRCSQRLSKTVKDCSIAWKSVFLSTIRDAFFFRGCWSMLCSNMEEITIAFKIRSIRDLSSEDRFIYTRSKDWELSKTAKERLEKMENWHLGRVLFWYMKDAPVIPRTIAAKDKIFFLRDNFKMYPAHMGKHLSDLEVTSVCRELARLYKAHSTLERAPLQSSYQRMGEDDPFLIKQESNRFVKVDPQFTFPRDFAGALSKGSSPEYFSDLAHTIWKVHINTRTSAENIEGACSTFAKAILRWREVDKKRKREMLDARNFSKKAKMTLL